MYKPNERNVSAKKSQVNKILCMISDFTLGMMKLSHQIAL